MTSTEYRPRTVGDLERRIAAALAAIPEMRERGMLPPILDILAKALCVEGGRLEVELCYDDGARIDSEAPADDVAPGDFRIAIGFRHGEARRARPAAAAPAYEQAAPVAVAEQVPVADDEIGRVLALVQRAEGEPRFRFLSLKYLRDTILAAAPVTRDWAPEVRQQVVSAAIDRGFLTAHKVPNPKIPQFPVAAVRLNRENPESLRLLEAHGPAPDFELPAARPAPPPRAGGFRGRR